MTKFIRFLLGAVQFEPAMLVALVARVVQALAGLGTLYFIVNYFTPEVQGYYQTFLSLVALQWFVELGMLVAIVSSVSHEWANLALNSRREISGSHEALARLSSIARFVARWFAGGAAIMFLGAGGFGVWLLSSQGNSEIWFAPWVATIAAAAIYLWLQGMVAVLEGCNQVLEVSLYRLSLTAVGSAALWAAVIGGAGLWSLMVLNAAYLVCAGVFVFGYYRRAIFGLLSRKLASNFDWKTDIWPMQWPLALQGLAGYFMFALFVPVIFAYRGVVEAGRMGISLQVAMALLSIAGSWLTVKLPRLGSMYKRGETAKFESVWFSVAALSVAAMLACAGLSILLVSLGRGENIPAADRFLDPLPFAILMGWATATLLVQCAAIYWRAQRREAVGFWGVAPGIASGAAIFWFGKLYGALGAVSGALLATLCVSLPIAGYFLLKSRELTRAHTLHAGLAGGSDPSDVVEAPGLGR